MHEQISHGLRTPLTSVLGYTSTLLDMWDTLDEAQRIGFVRIVYGEALRMAHGVEAVDRSLYAGFAEPAPRSGGLKQRLYVADAS